MPCYRPLRAYRDPAGGKIRFNEGGDSGPAIDLPCGRCIGCRIKRNQAWATRCMNEASLHLVNSFVTLTYNDTWHSPSLNYKDFQQFMYRLRAARGPTRFFAAGEYGEQNLRPHWHAILFGQGFENHGLVGDTIWRNRELEKLWPWGHSSVGEVTHQSAAYVAGYCIKKQTGPGAARYARVDLASGEIYYVAPEMGRMSLKPGIGEGWIRKHWRDVYKARDGIVQPGGYTQTPPRYYDKVLEKISMDTAIDKETERILNSKKYIEETSPQRLQTREKVAIAKQKLKRKKL